MNSIKFFSMVFLGIGLSLGSVSAQTGGEILDPNKPTDGVYTKMHFPNRRVVPYAFLREADVMWAKRIWREIDLREKMNQNYYYPIEENNQRKSLIKTIIDGILTDGIITPYSIDDDEFSVEYTDNEITSKITRVDSIWKTNPDPPYDTYMDVDTFNFDPTLVKKFKIKEDWVFDRQRSVMEPRIIGIAPIQTFIDQNTQEIKGFGPMFWVYFPQARIVLRNAEVYNRYNFSQRLTYDDVFMKRMFSSRIVKVDNEHDRIIESYLKGVNALLEAEEVKELLFTFEHDVWEQ